MSVVMSCIGGTETAASICGAIIIKGKRLTRSDIAHKFLFKFMLFLILLKRKNPEEIERIKPPNTAIKTATKEDCNPTPRNL